jgi:hypothetical protein
MTVENHAATRSEAFREQIAEMKIPAPNASRDKLLARVGMLLAVLGIVCGIVAYFMSHNTNDPLSQNDALAISLLGVTLAIVGAAVFLRYSFSQFLRLWLVRVIYEQQQRADR